MAAGPNSRATWPPGWRSTCPERWISEDRGGAKPKASSASGCLASSRRAAADPPTLWRASEDRSCVARSAKQDGVYLHMAFILPEGPRRRQATKRRHPSAVERLWLADEGDDP